MIIGTDFMTSAQNDHIIAAIGTATFATGALVQIAQRHQDKLTPEQETTE